MLLKNLALMSLLLLQLGCSFLGGSRTPESYTVFLYDPQKILCDELSKLDRSETDDFIFVSNELTRFLLDQGVLSELVKSLRDGRLQGAISILDTLLRDSELEICSELYLMKSVIYYSSGDSERSLEEVEKCIKFNPNLWGSYFHRYYVLERMGKATPENQVEALRLNPDAPFLEYSANGGLI